MTSLPFNDWLQKTVSDYIALNDEEKNIVLDSLILSSGPNQFFALSQRITELIFRDFISYLPPELSSNILQFLDGDQLLICCQVCKTWNERISSDTNIWWRLCKEAGVNVFTLGIAHSPSNCVSNVSCRQGQGEELSDTCKASHYKDAYLQTIATLKGFDTGKSIDIQEEFVDKSAWRITFVGFHGGHIVTGCDDHTVQIWSIPSGDVINTIATHSVCCLTLTDIHLYTASFNANAESWDLTTGEHCQTFCGHTSAVLAIDVTPDESFLLTGSVDRTAKLWDLRRVPTELVKTFSNVHEDWVFQVKFLPSDDSDSLFLFTGDSNIFYIWNLTFAGVVISSCHVPSVSPLKFTSFYHMARKPTQMFACQWLEESKFSWFIKYTIKQNPCTVQCDIRFRIPLDFVKSYLLGAGEKFAVIMCSISRKDFHVIDIPKKDVIATIVTPDFCMLTRNGSAVTLCDTTWLDGFDFSSMTKDTPVFAASVGRNTVILGTWAEWHKVKGREKK